jgi:hypothetical protein
VALSNAGWFCPWLANSFTLCLIGSFVLVAVLAVSCPELEKEE